MRFKIDWASLIVGRKSTVFALFYFVFEGNFQVQAPGGFFALPVWGAYIWRGVCTEGLIFGILRFIIMRGFLSWFCKINEISLYFFSG